MTLKDVHELIPEISISRLSNWEQGINMVSVDEAKKLANALKVPAAYLLTLDDSIIDDTERMLLEQFRAADMRGRKYILRAAQDETGQHGMAGQGQIAKLFNIPPSASGGASSSLPAFNTDKKTGDEEDVHE